MNIKKDAEVIVCKGRPTDSYKGCYKGCRGVAERLPPPGTIGKIGVRLYDHTNSNSGFGLFGSML